MTYDLATKVSLGVVILFFFFFDELDYIKEIHQAFKNICLDKMLSDGYFDMSIYIYGRIKKEDMYARLTAHESKYAILYKGKYPSKENAFSIWQEKINKQTYSDANYSEEKRSEIELSYEESSAIVNWVYNTMKDVQEREEFTKELLFNIKELHNIKQKIKIFNGVVYNAEKVELKFFTSLSKVNTFVSSLKKEMKTLFFRGHANPNYILRPSVMRTPNLQKNESKLYQELLINCPDDFIECQTHLEKLVKMQHYGLPTRLLDITRNPLVALYFACESLTETYGEIILITAENHDIKYPQSDAVSILASLPIFSYDKQQEFCMHANNRILNETEFNMKICGLIQEVRLEKPAFQAKVNRNDILKNYIVYALKNNNRIVKQDGAFILCGLSNEVGFLEKYRYREGGKKIIALIDKKESFLEQLDTFSINRAGLFPEIDCVSEYLKTKYS